MSEPHDRARILFTMGDVNGIGLEVLASALADPAIAELIDPVIVGNRRLVEEYVAIARPKNTSPLLSAEFIDIDSGARLRLGAVDAAAGRLAYDAIVAATKLVHAGNGDALVTMPISKEALDAAGCDFTAHTELIASVTGGTPLMILMTEGMLVALATIHIPLARVATSLNLELIVERILQLDQSLRGDFACAHPRIAVLGVNPHAGENGTIGRDEIDIVSPAIHSARAASIDASGPHPADGFFARYEPGGVDGILAMYHDQGLIPLKMFARGGGVNFTAGLPVVRTSPDHGTAFDIAGRNVASPASTIEAILTAVRVARNRRHSRA